MTTTPEQSAQPASLIHPTVLSPDLDSATVDATRWLINELRSDGMPREVVADIAAEHLADAVALYRTDAQRKAMRAADWYCTNRERAEQESAEIEACYERQNVRFQRMERSEATS